MGSKQTFKLIFTKAQVKELSKTELLVVTRDDLQTGNQIAQFHKLRYKTHQKNMHRQVFSDGFEVIKSITYGR